MNQPPKCPIRGHTDHSLKVLQTRTQDGTGIKADIWECPMGSHRWFLIQGNDFNHAVRIQRPRWGWSEK